MKLNFPACSLVIHFKNLEIMQNFLKHHKTLLKKLKETVILQKKDKNCYKLFNLSNLSSINL